MYSCVYLCMLVHAHAEGGTLWNKVILAYTITKAGTTLAQVLAREAIFGEDVMKKCTPFGNSHLNALPTAEMKQLKMVMFKQFP